MGEHLLDSDAVLEAERCLNDGLGIGQRPISVGTVAVVKTPPDLLAALSLEMTVRCLGFEYILLGSLNDHPEYAEELTDRVGGCQSHVNLIAYNPIEEEEFKRPDQSRIDVFRRVLERRGVAVSLRSSRGLDQNAACGQLRRQNR